MGFFGSGRRWAAAGCCVAVGVAFARPVHPAARPLSAWEQAERDRVAFDRSETHTKAEFGRMLDEYRAVYHGNPREVHAPAAVEAVAELLVAQGRELHDPASLKAAAGQYEFLRTQYPGSPLARAAKVQEARLRAGEVVGSVAEPAVARVETAPAVPAGIAPAVKEAPARKASSPGWLQPGGTGTAYETEARKEKAEPAADGPRLTEENARAEERAEKKKVTVADGAVVGAPVEGIRPTHHDETAMNGAPADLGSREGERPAVVAAKVGRGGKTAQVTGIRHWSTSTYTRVAIDLGDEVTFEAARVPHPDRIYFDLHGARLAQELVGKSFDVTDDGYLKRIRAAQFSGDMTRVVLDVSDVSDYSAFLLPNPYRLIIDIHGGGTRVKGEGLKVEKATAATPAETTPVEPAAVVRASAAANSSGLPAMAPTDGGELVKPYSPPAGTSLPSRVSESAEVTAAPVKAAKSVPAPRTGTVAKATSARPVPNTVTVKAPDTSTEVAAVSTVPGKVDASREASTKPVSETVTPSNPAVKDVYLGTANRKGRKASAGTDSSAPAKAAERTADGETSLVRALGLKIGRIVIDAGHGGHDSGTLGADGIEEKDVVLDVALRLGKLLHERLGAEIIYTRSDDTFIPLETRTAIANKAQADLFISVHANSSQDETARGVETYYLNFTSDPTALDVAARENAVSGSSIHQLSDLVKKITLKDKIAESREFASDVEGSLYAGLRKGNDGLKDRGVKKAPFVVLIGANMPSILAEISFVTNPKDAEQLRRPEYRERVAESLFNGVAKYENGLSGARPSAPVVRAAAQ